jgi:hypothetical protein
MPAEGFHRFYTREEVRALLPELRAALPRLREARHAMQSVEQKLRSLTAGGTDYGGRLVHDYLRAVLAFKELMLPLLEREIVVSDFEGGVVNFPALIAGRQALLVWEEGDADIEFWMDLQDPSAGPQRL